MAAQPPTRFEDHVRACEWIHTRASEATGPLDAHTAARFARLQLEMAYYSRQARARWGESRRWVSDAVDAACFVRLARPDVSDGGRARTKCDGCGRRLARQVCVLELAGPVATTEEFTASDPCTVARAYARCAHTLRALANGDDDDDDAAAREVRAAHGSGYVEREALLYHFLPRRVGGQRRRDGRGKVSVDESLDHATDRKGATVVGDTDGIHDGSGGDAILLLPPESGTGERPPRRTALLGRPKVVDAAHLASGTPEVAAADLAPQLAPHICTDVLVVARDVVADRADPLCLSEGLRGCEPVCQVGGGGGVQFLSHRMVGSPSLDKSKDGFGTIRCLADCSVGGGGVVGVRFIAP